MGRGRDRGVFEPRLYRVKGRFEGLQGVSSARGLRWAHCVANSAWDDANSAEAERQLGRMG